MKHFTSYTIGELTEVAKWIIDNFNNRNIIIINGEMGSGKTTLIKEIGKQLNVEQLINSPTFSIVNEYETATGEIIFHFDCYRIETYKEALEIGIPEYLNSGNRCFIEWAENIKDLLPDEKMLVTIKIEEKDSRSFSIE